MTDQPLYIDDIVPRRLVVELGRQNSEDLELLVGEEKSNKTTVMNRALELYLHIKRLEQRGGKIYVQEPEEDDAQRTRFFAND